MVRHGRRITYLSDLPEAAGAASPAAADGEAGAGSTFEVSPGVAQSFSGPKGGIVEAVCVLFGLCHFLRVTQI